MPIFHDLDETRTPDYNLSKLAPAPQRDVVMRRPSEESIRTEYLDGPLPDSDMTSTSPTHTGLAALADANLGISDRAELIQRIKRGESPTWVPNRTLEDYFHNHNDPPHRRSPESTRTTSSPLLPAAEIIESPKLVVPTKDEELAPASEIERPRSALHAGDFTQQENFSQCQNQRPTPPVNTEFEGERTEGIKYGDLPTAPWYGSNLQSDYSPFQADARFPPATPSSPYETPLRSPAHSLSSYSSSFILKAPTSPLVQSSTNTDLDLDLDFTSTTDPIDISGISIKASRRHTLPPRSFHSFQASPPSQPATPHSNRPYASLRREGTFPYQAHQPRRSLSSNLNLYTNSQPQTPAFLRSRRPSLSDVSPLQHAPMVGSYEESILRGRMSTVPSKPLNFMAQIGVLGLGNCKPNLRCPAHVLVPFPAVFYSYGSASVGRTSTFEEGPSPYVGLIDLENSLDKPDEGKQDRRKRRHVLASSQGEDQVSGNEGAECAPGISDRDRRRREKRKRRSTSPKAPPGGSYRIPQKGQLQIVIKNPNKTAVKLFLVPYDLQEMEPGMKTFIRQRSYSAGPIIETPITSNPSPGPQQFEKGSNIDSSKDRPTLRYLIHLHICCTSRGRYFLYKSIRVVFANRVPDGKEKLINEIQLPEPRYSTYKPSRDSNIGMGSTAGAALTAEKAFRRRSSGFGLQPGLDAMDGMGSQPLPSGFGGFVPFHKQVNAVTVEPIPFSLASLARPVASSFAATSIGGDMDVDKSNRIGARASSNAFSSFSHSSGSGIGIAAFPDTKSARPQSPGMSISSWRSTSTTSSGSGGYDKLSKGDVGYGGNAFVNFGSGGGEAGEGLLAKRLKGLDVQRAKGPEDDGI